MIYEMIILHQTSYQVLSRHDVFIFNNLEMRLALSLCIYTERRDSENGQGHTASEWPSLESNPGLSGPKEGLSSVLERECEGGQEMGVEQNGGPQKAPETTPGILPRKVP